MHIAIAITLMFAAMLAPLGLPIDLWKTQRIHRDIMLLMMFAIMMWFGSAGYWMLQHD
jgi:hypothetical protein